MINEIELRTIALDQAIRVLEHHANNRPITAENVLTLADDFLSFLKGKFGFANGPIPQDVDIAAIELVRTRR